MVVGGAGTPLTLLAGTRAAQAASGPKRHHRAPAPATAADEHCSTRARLARYLSSRARLRSPPGWHGRAHASGLLPWMEAPASPTRAVWKKLGSWAEAPARREKKKSTCVRIGRGATQRSSPQQQPASQQAPGPSLGNPGSSSLHPPPPSIRFDFLLPCLACLASTPSSLPPCPPPPSSTSFLLSFLLHLHLPSAICRLPPSCCCSISSLVKVRARANAHFPFPPYGPGQLALRLHDKLRPQLVAPSNSTPPTCPSRSSADQAVAPPTSRHKIFQPARPKPPSSRPPTDGTASSCPQNLPKTNARAPRTQIPNRRNG